MDKTDQINKLIQDIRKCKGSLTFLSNKLTTLQDELEEICPHDIWDEKKKYHHGGYDYVAKTDYTYTCKVCGKVTRGTVTHEGSGFE